MKDPLTAFHTYISIEDTFPKSEISSVEFFNYYEEQKTLHPFRNIYLGRKNPYSEKIIESQSDYNEYLREHSYHKLFDKKFRDTRIMQNAVANLHLRKTRAHYRKIIAVLLLLLAAAVVAAFLLSGRYSKGVSDGYASGERSGYQAGYSAGYSTGEHDGYQAGYSSGFQANTKQTGSSAKVGESSSGGGGSTGTGTPRDDPIADTYIGNKNSHKFHLPTCSWLPDTKNQVTFDSREDAISAGYVPCKRCNP